MATADELDAEAADAMDRFMDGKATFSEVAAAQAAAIDARKPPTRSSSTRPTSLAQALAAHYGIETIDPYGAS